MPPEQKTIGKLEVNPKDETKINIKLYANEFGVAPGSFLLVLQKNSSEAVL